MPMCEPVTAGIALLGMGLQAIGGVEAADAQREQGKANERYYNSLADTNEKQADIAIKVGESQATAFQDAGARETAGLKNQVKQFEGTQKAAMAAAGIGAGSGTAEDIVGDTFDKAKMDEMAIRYNADARTQEAVYNSKAQAWGLKEQARQYRIGGANARQAGDTNASATLLGTAGSVAGGAYNFSQTSGGQKLFGGGSKTFNGLPLRTYPGGR
jgi:hypothetical protein